MYIALLQRMIPTRLAKTFIHLDNAGISFLWIPERATESLSFLLRSFLRAYHGQHIEMLLTHLVLR